MTTTPKLSAGLRRLYYDGAHGDAICGLHLGRALRNPDRSDEADEFYRTLSPAPAGSACACCRGDHHADGAAGCLGCDGARG